MKRNHFIRHAVTGSVLLLMLSGLAPAETIVLKNGMQYEGEVGALPSLGSPSLSPFGAASGGNTGIKSVVLINDGLRRTFVPALQVTAANPGKEKEIKIRLDQQVAEAGYAINTIGPILKVTEFDDFGRRIFSMGGGPKGRIDAVQGITEITPLYARVQGLVATNSYVWDMRIATSSIPRQKLSAILRRANPNSSAHRLQIVSLLIEADRVQDARAELEEVVKDFPELEGLKDQIDTLRQIGAQRLIREIKLRREAGQHRMAYAMASEFPVEGVAGATLLGIRDIVSEYEEQKKTYDASLAELKAQFEKIEDAAVRNQCKPYADEIFRDMNVNTMSRLDDFMRLADDEKLMPEQKVALAISGWILGSGSGTENTAVASSVGKVRDLVVDYLASKRKQERFDILEKLKGLEGSSPAYLAKIVANMKPPLSPPQVEPEKVKVPGLYELRVPGVGEDAEFTYHVQLPPEYDPYRKYPCVVTLHAQGSTPEQQIDWWAGPFLEKSAGRMGQATRNGYIVIAPHWTKDHQQEYEYSTREHAAVLFALRDAQQRYSIDSDRIFLSGHSLGGEAAWDIGISHPDLWAGVMPISANCDKFITLYHLNARYVPWCFVVGEKDGKRNIEAQNTQWDTYLKRAGYDVTIVEYLGRGHEHFYDEIQRLFEWMKVHRRNFTPQEFKVVSVRESDNFFWFVEFRDPPPKTIVSPLYWANRGGFTPLRVEGKRMENNGVNIHCGAGGGTLFLSPELVDFERKTPLTLPNKRNRAFEPSAEVLLEDVRTRGDRQHPFWARVDF